MDKPPTTTPPSTTTPVPTPASTNPPSQQPPSPKPRLTICPYCGSQTRSHSTCESCRGKFDPLSRQATQNAMGPWFIRDEANPHRPGCAFETLIRQIERGGITADTVIRGPSSRQFWTLARWCPGIAHRLGICHSCQQPASPADTDCGHCGASFRVTGDRQQLGLGEVRHLPGQRSPGVKVDAHTTAPAARASVPQVQVSVAVAGQGDAAQEQIHGLIGSDAEDSTPEPAVDARYLRLERELRNSRRWRTVWAVGFSLVMLVVAGVFVVRALDLDAGPVGKWLNAREQLGVNASDEGGGEGGGAGSSAGMTPITPITTPDLSAGDDGAATTERTEWGLADQPGESIPDAVPLDTDNPEAMHVPPTDPADDASRVRLTRLASLRRLR